MAEPSFQLIQALKQTESVRPQLPSSAPTLDLSELPIQARDPRLIEETKNSMTQNAASALRTALLDPSLTPLIDKERIAIIADSSVRQARLGQALDGKKTLRVNPMILLNEMHMTRAVLFFLSAVEAGNQLGRVLPGQGKPAVEFGVETDKRLTAHRAVILDRLLKSQNPGDNRLGQALRDPAVVIPPNPQPKLPPRRPPTKEKSNIA